MDTVGRGPDELALALDAYRRVVTRLREIDRELPQLHSELRELGYRLDGLGMPQHPTFDKPLTAAIQHLDGTPFWDREPIA